MCVVGPQAAPVPPQHRPLLTCGSTASCSTRPTVAAATEHQKPDAAPKERRAAAPPGCRSGMSERRMVEKKKTTYGTRPRNEYIKVFVTEDERAELVERAAQAGMSQSAFLRAVGLNEPIRSVVDLQAVADLGKINGDLGRVAGLLKLWLAEKRGQGARPVDVEGIMKNFRKLQSEVLAIMSRVIK